MRPFLKTEYVGTLIVCLFLTLSTFGQSRVNLSHQRGFYETPFMLSVGTNLLDAEIRYTTSGSEPTPFFGTIYTGPISIDSTTVLRAIAYKPGGGIQTIVETHSYIFLDDIINQPYSIPGYPNAVRSTGMSSETEDYEMDPSVVTDPAYSADLLSGLREIPTMSVVMNKADFLLMYQGDDIEVETSIEIIYPNGKYEQIEGGIQAHSHNRLKRSMRLYFRDIYGNDKLKTDLFKNMPWNGATAPREVDRIVLRGGNNRCWARDWDSRDFTTYSRDEFYRQSQIAMSGFGVHGAFVHLYINGIYWGLYNPVERPDHWFSAYHLGGDETEYFSRNHSGSFSGNPVRYNYLHNVVKLANLDVTANYDEFEDYVDAPEFFDYLIGTWMIGMVDWPLNNWWSTIRNDPPGGIRYMAWDGEQSLGHDEWGSNAGAWVHPDFEAGQTNTLQIKGLWNSPKSSDRFLIEFADRVEKAIKPGGPMSDSSARARWQTINDYIRNAVVAESARWGDAITDGVTRKRDTHWQPEVDYVDGILDGNVEQFVSALQAEDYFPTLLAPVPNQDGGKFSPGFQVQFTNPNGFGQIYYTIDGDDPRNAGGWVDGSAISFFSPITINTNTTIIARVKQGTDWSPAAKMLFYTKGLTDGLKLTEISYHPEDFGVISSSNLEFLEFKNTGSTPIDLTQMYFKFGINYVFPNNVTLEPDSFWVICNNIANFMAKYPGRTPDGEYTGKLDNGGEKLLLKDPLDNTVIKVTYNDARGWPAASDGLGYTLVPIDPNPTVDQKDPRDWRSSRDKGGSPWADDPVPVDWADVGPIVNEIKSNTTPPELDLIELYNPGLVAVDLGGWYLTDDRKEPFKYRIPDGTLILPNGYKTYDESSFGVGIDGFRLSRRGEAVYLFSTDGAGNLTGYESGWKFGAQFDGVATGTYTNSEGETFFTGLENYTFGFNAQPRINPVIVEKLDYHPINSANEFITLKNITDAPVNLYHPDYPNLAWRIEGINFEFPSNYTLDAYQRVILSRKEPAVFRADFDIDPAVDIFKYDFVLDNGGEEVDILIPDDPDTVDCVFTVPYVSADLLNYSDRNNWPLAADGVGTFLQRVDNEAFANDPLNWEDGCVRAKPDEDPGACLPLLVTEINYNSLSGADPGDWIELHNTGTTALDLSNYLVIKGGLEPPFTIPPGTVINPGGYLVMVNDATKFTTVFPSVLNYIGEFPYDLNPDEEDNVIIFDDNGDQVIGTVFSNEEPWPLGADGSGYTLELLDYGKSMSQASNWFTGCPGGSPGQEFDPGCGTGCEVTGSLGAIPSATIAVLSWDAVDAATGYIIYGRVAGTTAAQSVQLTGTGTTFTVPGLTPATTYEWTVRTRCGDVIADFAPISVFTTLSPRLSSTIDAIRPNPVQNELILTGFLAEESEVAIRIMTLNGDELKHEVLSMDMGDFSKMFDVSDLPAGMYLLECVSETYATTERFVKISD